MENELNELYDQAYDKSNKELLDNEKKDMEKKQPSDVKDKNETSEESEEDKKKDSGN
ncbi:MAG: hypothetical protein ACI33K_09755 [Clostridiaceae bacterium]|mgnify:CR=1 FL=1